MLDDAELIDDFVEEARDHLNRIETLLSDIDTSDPRYMDAISDVFRGMHSIKGAAGLLELPNVRDVSHAAETVLAAVRGGTHEPTPTTTQALPRGRDRLSETVDELRREAEVDATAEITALNALLAEKVATPQDASPESQAEPAEELDGATSDDEPEEEVDEAPPSRSTKRRSSASCAAVSSA